MNSQHTLKPFGRDLQLVQSKIVGMAQMVSQELSDSLQAFSKRDQERAIDAAGANDLINASERIIDDLIVKTIVLHQPMATDCRLLVAALRISKDLERISDYATNIANHSHTLDELDTTGAENLITKIGHAILNMMQDLITAYEQQDADAAEMLRAKDEEIDTLYTHAFADLVAISTQTPALSSACTHLILIARSLERIGDHITDIAEEILFVVNGEFPTDNRRKADKSALVK